MSDVFDLGSMTTVATATGQYSFYTPPPPTPIPYLTYIARPGINKFDLPEGAKIKDLIKRYQYERSQVPAAIMIRGVQEEIKNPRTLPWPMWDRLSMANWRILLARKRKN
ncbi:hypothetical protein P4126_05965 [Pseudomonas aeruginosa]|nr:hypothetical protein [Pseudomonas aeruginosa]